MDTAHKRHPGTVRVAAPGWAIPVGLLPDELLSSWLVRTALANGCDPLTFTGAIWPKWRVWTGDVDRYPPTDRLVNLSIMSNIPVDTLEASTLSPTVRRILGELPRKDSAWPWILAVGARNRRRSGGLQYCPICLSEDAKPYFRRQWRLAWHTGCEKHGCQLEDRCPGCGAPIEPHRQSAEIGLMGHCSTCRASLSEVNPAPLSGHALKFQTLADEAAASGTTWFDGAEVGCCDWFSLARFYTGLVRRIARRESAWLVKLGQVLDVQSEALIDSTSLELLRTRDRALLFDGVSKLLDVLGEKLGDLLMEANVSKQAFFPKGTTIPTVLTDFAGELADKPITRKRSKTTQRSAVIPSPKPRHEVERMMARLRRKVTLESP